MAPSKLDKWTANIKIPVIGMRMKAMSELVFVVAVTNGKQLRDLDTTFPIFIKVKRICNTGLQTLYAPR